MRSILCPIDRSETLDDRIETALALARATNGHVAFQIATPFAQMAVWEPFGGAAISAAAINDARELDNKLAHDLNARLAKQDVAFDVTIDDQGRVEAAISAARLADLVVATLDDPALEEIVLSVRLPVLAVPNGLPKLAFDGPVLVAWDGGYECANAMRTAMPLLKKASAVHLLTVREKDGSFPGSDAARYLSRHGIHAQLHERESAGAVAQTIEECAHEMEASLIVMGLFGHSRLRELIMGGVSRHMLDRSKTALLLSH